jgi:hypothetical protein
MVNEVCGKRDYCLAFQCSFRNSYCTTLHLSSMELRATRHVRSDEEVDPIERERHYASICSDHLDMGELRLVKMHTY